jgi:hypothetical protein
MDDDQELLQRLITLRTATMVGSEVSFTVRLPVLLSGMPDAASPKIWEILPACRDMWTSPSDCMIISEVLCDPQERRFNCMRRVFPVSCWSTKAEHVHIGDNRMQFSLKRADSIGLYPDFA